MVNTFKNELSLKVDMGMSQKRTIRAISYLDGILTSVSLCKVMKKHELYLSIAYMGRKVISEIILDAKNGISSEKVIGKIIDVNFENTREAKYITCKIQICDELIDLFNKNNLF